MRLIHEIKSVPFINIRTAKLLPIRSESPMDAVPKLSIYNSTNLPYTNLYRIFHLLHLISWTALRQSIFLNLDG